MFAVDDNNLSNRTVNFVYVNDQLIQFVDLLQRKKIRVESVVWQSSRTSVFASEYIALKVVKTRKDDVNNFESQLIVWYGTQEMQHISFGASIGSYKICSEHNLRECLAFAFLVALE